MCSRGLSPKPNGLKRNKGKTKKSQIPVCTCSGAHAFCETYTESSYHHEQETQKMSLTMGTEAPKPANFRLGKTPISLTARFSGQKNQDVVEQRRLLVVG